MNYTLKQLQDRVNNLIEQQGEDALCGMDLHCWRCQVLEGVNSQEHYPAVDNPELAERIFNDVGNIDYIYQVIQECVDESTEEQLCWCNRRQFDDTPTGTSTWLSENDWQTLCS